MINNVAGEFDSRPQVVESLRNDSELPLYEGCSKYTRLSATLKLFNLKAKNGWSDKSFNEVLSLVKDMLPDGNTLPNRIMAQSNSSGEEDFRAEQRTPTKKTKRGPSLMLDLIRRHREDGTKITVKFNTTGYPLGKAGDN
ncbi:hypothetical protein QQ045_004802 [Rhodiola kirilowii]